MLARPRFRLIRRTTIWGWGHRRNRSRNRSRRSPILSRIRFPQRQPAMPPASRACPDAAAPFELRSASGSPRTAKSACAGGGAGLGAGSGGRSRPSQPGGSEAAADASSDTPHGDAFRGSRPPDPRAAPPAASARRRAWGCLQPGPGPRCYIELDGGPFSAEVLFIHRQEEFNGFAAAGEFHILGEVADEPGIMSVGSAGLLSPSTIVCRSEDAAAVHAAAEACGSPDLGVGTITGAAFRMAGWCSRATGPPTQRHPGLREV